MGVILIQKGEQQIHQLPKKEWGKHNLKILTKKDLKDVMTYFLILYKSFEYDINFTSKNLTSNKGKPVKKL